MNKLKKMIGSGLAVAAIVAVSVFTFSGFANTAHAEGDSTPEPPANSQPAPASTTAAKVKAMTDAEIKAAADKARAASKAGDYSEFGPCGGEVPVDEQGRYVLLPCDSSK